MQTTLHVYTDQKTAQPSQVIQQEVEWVWIDMYPNDMQKT